MHGRKNIKKKEFVQKIETQTINKYVLGISHNTTILLISGTLWYQLHVSANILTIVRLYSKILR